MAKYTGINIPIEFSATVPGVDIRKHPKMREKNPTAVAQEGPESQPGHWPEKTKPTPHEERMVYPGDGMILAEDLFLWKTAYPMRLGIISYIHGNLEALKQVLADIDQSELNGVVCLGDNIGYGPEPEEVVRLIRKRNIP
jgi:hypothetical protein